MKRSRRKVAPLFFDLGLRGTQGWGDVGVAAVDSWARRRVGLAVQHQDAVPVGGRLMEVWPLVQDGLAGGSRRGPGRMGGFRRPQQSRGSQQSREVGREGIRRCNHPHGVVAALAFDAAGFEMEFRGPDQFDSDGSVPRPTVHGELQFAPFVRWDFELVVVDAEGESYLAREQVAFESGPGTGLS